MMIITRIKGWFYRVMEEGEIKVGDKMKLIERKFGNFTIEKLQIATFGNKTKIREIFQSEEEYADYLYQLVHLPPLAEIPWKSQALSLLKKHPLSSSYDLSSGDNIQNNDNN